MKKIGPKGGARPKFYWVDPPLIALRLCKKPKTDLAL